MQFHNPQQLGRHLLDMFKRGRLCKMSTNAQPTGSYRDTNGKPCAIGLFIPDDLAKSIKELGLNEETVVALKNAGINLEPYFPGLTTRELTKIQNAFDSGQRARFNSVVRRVCGLPKLK
jgi:hypothetical protein